MVWIGLISFPLYLWHWLLLAYWPYIRGAPLASSLAIELVFYIAISIALAWFSYFVVERPLRSHKNSRIKTLALIFTMLIVLSLGIFTSINGFSNYGIRSSEQNQFEDYFHNKRPYFEYLKK